MISFHFQGKPFNITVIQVYALTSNAEEAEVEWFYEDLHPIPPSIRVFSNESTLHEVPKYWSFSFSISLSNEHPGLISLRMDCLDILAAQGTLKSLLQHHSSKVELFNFSFFSITGQGIDLDYCDIEWFALEMKRDHSVVLRLHPSTVFWTLLLTMIATPFLLRDSCPQ